MSFLVIFKAIFIGIIEGLTEFLPISSTAHLLITSEIINFKTVKNNVFEIFIQLGAIMAVCIFYRQKLLATTIGFFQEKSSRLFIFNILAAFLPSVIFGVLFYEIIKNIFFSLEYIAFALIIGGIIIIIVEKSKIKEKCSNVEDLSLARSLSIGLFQVLAMIPGVSRSGATIIGSMILGVNRKAATEFSFFLAIPTMFAAVIYDLYKNWQVLDIDNIQIILIGFFSAFISALLVIKWLLNFISNHNFMIFAYYRIILGCILIFMIF